MKKYYKFVAKSKRQGQGEQFIEFDGEWAVRQVEHYQDQWLSVSLDTPREKMQIRLCDQPLHLFNIQPEEVSNDREFDTAWQNSLAQILRIPAA
jgi:hypothetical protein